MSAAAVPCTSAMSALRCAWKSSPSSPAQPPGRRAPSSRATTGGPMRCRRRGACGPFPRWRPRCLQCAGSTLQGSTPSIRRLVRRQRRSRRCNPGCLRRSVPIPCHLAAAITFRTWLYGVARNVCRHHLRQHAGRGRFHDRSTDVDDVCDDARGPLQRLEDSNENAQLMAYIARLPWEQRVTLMLRAWEGMSYDEIAAVMEVPKGTVRSRLHSARRVLARPCGRVGSLAGAKLLRRKLLAQAIADTQ